MRRLCLNYLPYNIMLCSCQFCAKCVLLCFDVSNWEKLFLELCYFCDSVSNDVSHAVFK